MLIRIANIFKLHDILFTSYVKNNAPIIVGRPTFPTVIILLFIVLIQMRTNFRVNCFTSKLSSFLSNTEEDLYINI